MKNFEKRRDRFEFFDAFENPLVNLSFDLEMEDFRPYCKAHNIPPFHFFLFHLIHAFDELDNFKYRIYQGEIIKVDELYGSYTVINQENLLNYTRFKISKDLPTFLKNSLESKVEAEQSLPLINTGVELSEREMKNYIFITCIPWLRLTSIEHPVFKYKSADIPSVAWGKFTLDFRGQLLVPMAVQAHHGFVDGFHITQFAELLKKKIETFIKA